MSDPSPFFTILMPTRDRAHRLRLSLKSALHQTFEDYEVVVCDNASQDDTRAVAEAAGSPKVRYVRSPEPLSMPDNWEFALDQARGRYVTYLCDDDALLPHALERLAVLLEREPIDTVCWHRVTYYYPDWIEPWKRNALLMYTLKDAMVDIDCVSAIREKFKALRYNPLDPMLLNCACSRQFLSEVRRVRGRVFYPPAPDVSAGVLIQAFSRSYRYLHEPLALIGACTESIGAATAYDRGAAVARFEKEFKGDIFADVPLKAMTISNTIAATLLNLKSAFPEVFRGHELDRTGYFFRHQEGLVRLKTNAVDISGDEKEMYHAAAGIGIAGRLRVRAAFYSVLLGIRKAMLQWFPAGWADQIEFFVLGRLLAVPGYGRSIRIVRGESGGFSDIYECARVLGDRSRRNSWKDIKA